MTIEIWSDYACPFCYIGEAHLTQALKELNAENISVTFKSFELDPEADIKVMSSTAERFAEKYGMSLTAATERIEEISSMGRTAGLDFKYLTTRYTNTFDAHRLAKFAQDKGRDEIVIKLFDAYFTKNLELANFDVLKKIAVECGLDGREVDDMLNSDSYAEDVRADELTAARLGIHAVPYFVIGGKYGLSGAQPVEILKQTIKDASSTENFGGMTCGVDGCR